MTKISKYFLLVVLSTFFSLISFAQLAGNIKSDKATIPFTENWEDDSTWSSWTVIDNNGDVNFWEWIGYGGSNESSCAGYFSGGYTGDDWLISPILSLQSNKSYELSFWFENIYVAQSLRVYIGDSPTPTSLSTILIDLPSIDEMGTTSTEFTVPSDGDYYIGFYCYTELSEFAYLSIDDIHIQEQTLLGIPGNIVGLEQVPGENGEISMGLTWTNPSLTYGGDPLNEISAINIYKDEATTPISYTENLSIGGLASWTDPDPVEGEHTYRITVVNSLGENNGNSVDTYIGYDLPQGPENLLLEENGGIATISWSGLPEFGVKGGWYDPNNITFRIVRNPGHIVLETNYSGGSTYVDNTISSLDVYTYSVTAKNNDGAGGTSESNEVVIGNSLSLPYTESWENFNTLQLWTVHNVNNDIAFWERNLYRGNNQPTCIYYNSQFGDIPEANDWLITPKFNLESGIEYRLTYYIRSHILQVFDGKITIGNDASVISQTTTLAEYFELDLSDQYIKQTINFTVPENSNYNLGFYVSWGASNIYIDDITIEESLDIDLKALSVGGSTAPTINTPTTNTFKIYNNGSESVNSYTVQLLDVEDNVLATEDINVSLAPGETSELTLSWTPTIEGEYTIRGKVICDSDEAMANNITDLYNLNIQPSGLNVVTIGNESNLSAEIPLNAFTYTFCESVYQAADFGNVIGTIESIAYKVENVTDGVEGQHFKIWMGETDKTSLCEGWIPSTDNLELVFDQTINIPYGNYDLNLELDQLYNYTGGNLVIMIQGVGQIGHYGLKFFVSEYNYAATRYNNGYYEGDPEDPDNDICPFTDNIPNTMFFINTESSGDFSGFVYEQDGVTPISGAEVSIGGTYAKQTTDENGYYEFPYVTSGEYTITASKVGYIDGENSLILSSNQSASLDFSLNDLTPVVVSGTVLDSENSEGIGNILVTLSGYANFITTTDSEGNFEFTDVFGERDYLISIYTDGYTDYSNPLVLGNENVQLADILLVGLTSFPPTAVVAADNVTDATITWETPSVSSWISKDNEVDYGIFGTSFSPYSVGHRYTPQDLEELYVKQGSQVTKLKIFVCAIGNFTLKVWSGDTGIETEIYSEEIEPILNQWNEYTLETSVPIDVSKNLIVGYQVDHLHGLNPISFDSGPLAFNGDVLLDGGLWTTAHDVIPGWNYNFNIQAYCSNNSKENSFKLKNKSIREKPLPQTKKISEKSEYSFIINNEELKSSKLFFEKANSFPIGYKVWRLLEGQEELPEQWILLTETDITETAFQDLTWDNLPNGNYKYAVKAIYIPSNSEAIFSNVLMKVIENIDENIKPENIQVFPNPNHGQFSVFLKEPALATITDVYGREIFNKRLTSHENNITLKNEQGIYFLNILSRDKTFTFKILIKK